MMEATGPKKIGKISTATSAKTNLDPIIEENADGSANNIYIDPDDPKKKKYDELKRKALLVT